MIEYVDERIEQYHILSLIIFSPAEFEAKTPSSQPWIQPRVKTGRLEKILNEAINHKEIAYIIYSPG